MLCVINFSIVIMIHITTLIHIKKNIYVHPIFIFYIRDEN